MSASWQDLLDAEQAGGIVIDGIEGVGSLQRGPKPGDVIKFHNAQGQGFETRVTADGSLPDPVPTSRLPAESGTRKSGVDTYPSADDVAKGAPDWAKKHYEAVRGQTGVTAQDMDAALNQLRQADKDQTAAQGAAKKTADDTAALAALATAKMKAGQDPSQSEAEAWMKLNGMHAQAQPSQYTMPIQGYTGQIAPHHAGNEKGAVDLFAPPGTPIVSATSGTVVRAGPYGAAGNEVFIQGDDGHFYDYEHTDGLKVKPGDKVTTGQPLGVVATLENGGSSVGDATHVHFAVTTAPDFRTDEDGGQHGINFADPNSHGTATDFDTLGFVQGLAKGQQPGATGPGGVPSLFAPKTERHTIGSKVYEYDPATGNSRVVIDASGETVPTLHQMGNIAYQYDPKTKTWQQAIVGPQSGADIQAQLEQKGKFQVALEQANSTKAYIQQQLAAGVINPQQADQYQAMNLKNMNAALAGTTVYDMQKDQQAQDTQRAQIAKDLLDTKLQTGAQMADSMLSTATQGVTSSKYGTLAPGALKGLYEGVLRDNDQRAGGQSMSDLAQSLLMQIAPHAAAAGIDPRLSLLTGGAGVGGPPPSGAGGPGSPIGPTAPALPMPPGGGNDSDRLAAMAAAA